jgi:paraquat-inducible protein A
MNARALSAAEAGLVSCDTCVLLSRPASLASPGHCPRCGAGLMSRRPHSIQYTWALVIAAAIFYIPANVLPVLTTTAFGETESDTIMGGVIFLYTSGSWPLALIVFIASVMIPLGKLVALAYLLITVQRGSVANSHERTRIYIMVEFIGRWSMLDVFVDAFIVALIQLKPLMSVEPGLASHSSWQSWWQWSLRNRSIPPHLGSQTGCGPSRRTTDLDSLPRDDRAASARGYPSSGSFRSAALVAMELRSSAT